MLAVPELLTRMTVARLGAAGTRWLGQLPERVRELEQRWSLTVGEPFTPGGVTALVAPATRADGTAAVLKIALLDRETMYEADALERYDGDGAVRLLAADPALGALLLERCDPGTSLLALPDEVAANEVAATVLRRLWRSVEDGHPFDLATDRAAEWAASVPREFAALGRPFEPALADQAAALFRELAHPPAEPVLLHQDFHHDNVLAARREPWLAIDPKPLVGDPAFDTGSLLRDRRAELAADPDPARRLARRFDQLAEQLDLDRARMRAWALAQIVELALWSLSVGDVEDAQHEIACARVLARL